MKKPKFKQYSYVQKKTGYKYPGMVMCVFRTRAGLIRYVVEATHPDFKGMCHIFSEKQLKSTLEEQMKEVENESNAV